MTIQPDYVKEELLHELSESFCMHNQLPPDLFTRYRIKRGLRNADGTGVLVGASHLGNVHGYILNEGEREPIEGRLTYRGYNVYDLIHVLESYLEALHDHFKKEEGCAAVLRFSVTTSRTVFSIYSASICLLYTSTRF